MCLHTYPWDSLPAAAVREQELASLGELHAFWRKDLVLDRPMSRQTHVSVEKVAYNRVNA